MLTNLQQAADSLTQALIQAGEEPMFEATIVGVETKDHVALIFPWSRRRFSRCLAQSVAASVIAGSKLDGSAHGAILPVRARCRTRQ